MASRVNTKFVVILIVAVIAMLGMLFAAYSVVYKTPADLAALGDKAMAEGDTEQAISFYSKAVNKDRTNAEYLEKWISSLETKLPETEPAYYDAYRDDYLGGIHQLASVQRTNVEAYERELGMMLRSFQRGYSRGQADQLITRTTEVLGNFDGVPGVDPQWPVLRRYRGIAWQQIGLSNGVIDETQLPIVREDLEAALEANPSDDLTRSSLMHWVVYEATRIRNDARREAALKEKRDEAIAIAEAHLSEYPNSPLVLLTKLMTEMEVVRGEIITESEETDAVRSAAVQEALESFQPQVESAFQQLNSMPVEKLTSSVLNKFRLVEYLAEPENTLDRTIALYEGAIEVNPTNTDFLLSAAAIYTSRNEIGKATEMYQRIVDLPIPPLSFEGVTLFNAQREALITLASTKLNEYEVVRNDPDSTEEEIQAVLNEAISARDEYAARVSEDNTPLMLIDGQIAYANGEVEEAFRLFKQFVGLIQNPRMRARGLWLEAVTARELGQFGTARDALIALLENQRYDIRALLMLADIESQLENFQSAKLRYEEVLKYAPDNRVARTGITNINALENPDLIEDPALALIVRARGLRRGDNDSPGDISAAITTLSEGIESVGYASSATRELASMLLDQGDIDGARALVDRAVAANPDSEDLQSLRRSLQSDDEVDILVAMAIESNEDRLEQLVTIARIAFSRSRSDLLDETLVELNQLAPDDSRVIDFSFVRALELDNLEAATEYAARAEATNADRVNGLSYKARVASSQDDHQRAVQLLEQATASGTADSSLFRMLAIEQYQLGKMDLAISSFERALAVSPDDQASILAYLNSLVNIGRYPEALDIARRFQRYANDNPQFMFLWLSLEARYGGEEGQEYAIKQREKMLELDPDNYFNKFALADLYIETGRWDGARAMIDELKAEDESLEIVELEARWYANQGRVGNLKGVETAREIFLAYIEKNKADITADPYIALAEFMVQRGRPDLAVQAAMDAVTVEDPDSLDGTKLLGNLYMTLNNYSSASEAFKKIIESGKDEDDQYRLRWIDMLIRTRQYQAAREQFDQLSSERQNRLIAMLQSSEIEEGLGNMDNAARLLDQAVAAYPDNPLVYIKRAEFNAGDPESMTDLLADVDAALQINNNDWRAYRVRAAGYFAIDERDDALRDLMRAVQLNPGLDQALFGIVNELMIDGRNADAFEFALEIASKRRDNARLIGDLGSLFASRDDWENAVEFFKIAWDSTRSPGSGATLIDAIVRTRNPNTDLANSVINDLTEIAGSIDESPGLLAAQALVLQARGRDELAIQQLTKAFDLSSNSDILLIQWSGNISRYYLDKPMSEQIQYLETLKRRNPNQEVLNWLDLFIAQRLISVGAQRDVAIAIFDRLKQASSQPKLQQITYQSYGQAMYGEGAYERAAEVWAEGSELFPDDWEMSNNLAYVLSAELGKHEEALGLAESAIRANSERSEPYDTLGRIYTALGKYDLARETLSEGMRYALSTRARVTLMLGQIELDLQMNDPAEAKSKMVDIRSMLRAMPTRDTGLESEVEAAEEKIGSAG
ncbi:MAG: tetratricopeptide repeat protein [Phycisphaerales bacterium]|nr:tetratricopeptide repeat protein [Phycisphaerales bacterium]